MRLAALHAGFTVVQPSHLFSPGLLASEDLRGMAGGSYGVQQLTIDLTAVYSSAGVKVSGVASHSYCELKLYLSSC